MRSVLYDNTQSIDNSINYLNSDFLYFGKGKFDL